MLIPANEPQYYAMSEKEALEYLKKYASEFSAIILAQAYDQKETLNGHELLKLTPIKKINQHIVGRLSEHWNGQIQHFTSPYFNFDAEDVKAALEHFSNVVSQHIALRREHLQPWLQDVATKTLAPLAGLTSLSEGEEELVRQFSVVHPLVLHLPEPVATPPAAPTNRSVSFFQSIRDEEEETEAPAAPALTVAPPHIPEPTPEAAPVARPAAQAAPPRPEPLNSRFQVETPQYATDVTYGSVRLKLESIGQSISLAQRFMFVGQLFKGDFDAFSQAIATLDSAADWQTANGYISDELATRYGWDLKSEAVGELLTLVKRRFN